MKLKLLHKTLAKFSDVFKNKGNRIRVTEVRTRISKDGAAYARLAASAWYLEGHTRCHNALTSAVWLGDAESPGRRCSLLGTFWLLTLSDQEPMRAMRRLGIEHWMPDQKIFYKRTNLRWMAHVLCIANNRLPCRVLFLVSPMKSNKSRDQQVTWQRGIRK